MENSLPGCQHQGPAVLPAANSARLVPGPRLLLTVRPRQPLQHLLPIHTPKPQQLLRPSLGLSPLPAFGLLSTSQVRVGGGLSGWVWAAGVNSRRMVVSEVLLLSSVVGQIPMEPAAGTEETGGQCQAGMSLPALRERTLLLRIFRLKVREEGLGGSWFLQESGSGSSQRMGSYTNNARGFGQPHCLAVTLGKLLNPSGLWFPLLRQESWRQGKHR